MYLDNIKSLFFIAQQALDGAAIVFGAAVGARHRSRLATNMQQDVGLVTCPRTAGAIVIDGAVAVGYGHAGIDLQLQIALVRRAVLPGACGELDHFLSCDFSCSS